MIVKILFTILVLVLTILPIAEVTRLIIMNALINNRFPEVPDIVFYRELFGIWTAYLAAMGIVFWRIR